MNRLMSRRAPWGCTGARHITRVRSSPFSMLTHVVIGKRFATGVNALGLFYECLVADHFVLKLDVAQL